MAELRASPNLLTNSLLSGDFIQAREWNQVADHINRQNSGVATPRQLPNAADLQNLIQMGRFRIKSIQGEYLVCVEWNGATEGTVQINIDRPFLLRTSNLAHNDATFVYTGNETRTASAPAQTDETQVIVPAYVVDDEIIAVKGITRGTGAIGTGNTKVVWEDLNIDARAWAKEAS